MYSFKTKQSQRGMTLIEILIASALGVVIILGVSRSMTALSQSSGIQQGQNNIQQTADLALSYLGLRLRNALSTPCNQINALNAINISTLQDSTATAADPDSMTATDQTSINNLTVGHGISVTQAAVTLNGVAVSQADGTAVAAVTTDNISLISAKDKLRLNGESGIQQPGTNAVSTLTIQGIFPAANNDNNSLYVITNCENMDVFRANRAEAGTTTTLTTVPNTLFSINYRGTEAALVSRLSASTIGIDNNGNLFDRPMFGAVAGNTLMDDVELVRILFGVDVGNDGLVDRYITASQLAGLPSNIRVLTAEVFLLVQTDSAAAAVPTNYVLTIPDTSANLPNTGVIPMHTLTITDRVMRRVFSRSITFRNKVAL